MLLLCVGVGKEGLIDKVYWEENVKIVNFFTFSDGWGWGKMGQESTAEHMLPCPSHTATRNQVHKN